MRGTWDAPTPGWVSRMLGFSSCSVAVMRPHRPSPISGGASCVARPPSAPTASRAPCFCFYLPIKVHFALNDATRASSRKENKNPEWFLAAKLPEHSSPCAIRTCFAGFLACAVKVGWERMWGQRRPRPHGVRTGRPAQAGVPALQLFVKRTPGVIAALRRWHLAGVRGRCSFLRTYSVRFKQV